MITAASYRGQPLVVLLLLIGGWVALRAVALDAAKLPTAAPDVAGASAIGAVSAPAQNAAPAFGRAPEMEPDFVQPDFIPPSPAARAVLRPLPRSYRPGSIEFPFAPLQGPRPAPLPSRSPAAVPTHVSTAYQMQSMVPANLPLAPGLVARPVGPGPAQSASRKGSHWSADGWLLLRSGGSVVPGSGFAPSSYGASQAGAVVRYRLAPASAYRPALYLRGSAALNGSREREVAFGISARPIAGVPLAMAAEARVNSQPGGTRLRPATFAYTELPPVALGRGLKAELYGQAGYVGGSFASLFADGQLRVDSRVVRLGRGELRAGGGAWGGAQRGASRLDVGPTATLGVPLGETAAARVGVDWRFRVAGSAAPESGPALTLSAGF